MTPIVLPADRMGKTPNERAPSWRNLSFEGPSGSSSTSFTMSGCPDSRTRNETVGRSGVREMRPEKSPSSAPPYPPRPMTASPSGAMSEKTPMGKSRVSRSPESAVSTTSFTVVDRCTADARSKSTDSRSRSLPSSSTSSVCLRAADR